MHVLLINGSPNKSGCTHVALSTVAEELNKTDITTEEFHIGKKAVHGCIACHSCLKTSRCAFNDDPANEIIEKLSKADGVVIGSPVYFAGPNGALCALLDRVFFAAGAQFYHKPAAAVVSCRRGGSGSAFDRLNKYFTISNMPVVSSQYWNHIHGNSAEEARSDIEGIQIMQTLGKNMAWMLSAVADKKAPEIQPRMYYNFIR